MAMAPGTIGKPGGPEATHRAGVAHRPIVVLGDQALDRQFREIRLQASMAKYLAVDIARQIGAWTADLFGAASVMADHPAHRFPLDAWASSLGEGTQDIQKLIIARHILPRS